MTDSHAVLTAVIAAAVSLVVAIIAAVASLIVQTRNNYLQAVTAERSKWIDKLRSNISLLSGMIRTLSYKNLSHAIVFNSPDYLVSLDEINKMVSVIRLQLNPNGAVDRNILRLIARLPFIAESSTRHSELRHGDDLLIAHAQWLLKDEWEKVKREADIFKLFRSRCPERKRETEYQEFCETHDVDTFLKQLTRPGA